MAPKKVPEYPPPDPVRERAAQAILKQKIKAVAKWGSHWADAFQDGQIAGDAKLPRISDIRGWPAKAEYMEYSMQERQRLQNLSKAIDEAYAQLQPFDESMEEKATTAQLAELVKKYSKSLVADPSGDVAMQKLAAKIVAMTKRNPELPTEFQKWEKDWGRLEKRLKQQSERQDERSRTNIDLQSKYEDLKRDAEKTKNELQKKVNDVEDYLEKGHTECEKKDQQIKHLTDQNEKLQSEDMQVDDSDEVKRLKSENQELLRQLVEMEKERKTRAAANPDLERCQERVEEAEGENEQLRAENGVSNRRSQSLGLPSTISKARFTRFAVVSDPVRPFLAMTVVSLRNVRTRSSTHEPGWLTAGIMR